MAGNKTPISLGDKDVSRETQRAFQRIGRIVSGQVDFEFLTPIVGVILRAPNGTRWQVTVTNSGALQTTLLP